jgi:hypothetical protein
MKSIVFLAALLFGGSASAQTFSAAELHDYCLNDRAIIAGYVAGVVDKSDIDYGSVKNLFHLAMPSEMKPNTIAAVNTVRNHCRPKDATIGRAVELLCKSIADHPHVGSMSGAELLDQAMNLAWPCN